jgi:hypothetical protein
LGGSQPPLAGSARAGDPYKLILTVSLKKSSICKLFIINITKIINKKNRPKGRSLINEFPTSGSSKHLIAPD